MDTVLNFEDNGKVVEPNEKKPQVNIFYSLKNPPTQATRENPVFEVLLAEGRENFVKYIEWLGLADDPNIVVLPSHSNYYYDAEEMKSVKTVINLKKLNKIKEIRSFLQTVFNHLPYRSNFIGCFVDNNRINTYSIKLDSASIHKKKSINAIENGIVSDVPFVNMIYSFMDSRTNKNLSEVSVSFLLDELGFKILDMTELNGLTYFHSQKAREYTGIKNLINH